MRKNLLLIAGLLLSHLAASAVEVGEPPAKPVPFEVHDGYFVSNKFKDTEPVSCVVIRDQPSFDKVFGVAMVMGDKAHRLPAAAFAKKFVVTVIHRGKALVTYQVQSVAANGQALVVRFTAGTQSQAGAEFACPLIIALDKRDYKSVEFIENGTPLKRLKLPSSNP